jgi:UDP-N-acetyl-D-glucosamine dehydrogenase
MEIYKDKLIQKISNKDIVIGVIGLGYVGLPLALGFIEQSFKIIGFDIDKNKNLSLNKGKSYIESIPSKLINNAIKKGFLATDDYSKTKECDALIICVPTPLNKYREPDLSYVLNTMNLISPFLSKGKIISLESTTWPGTTEELLLPILQSKGIKIGEDGFLVFSPEREDPGNEKYSTKTIPKVIGGITSNCIEVGVELYSGIIDKIVPVSSTRVAEMSKLLENIHRAVNIGLVNELKMVCDFMDIDIHEVIAAASTKPFGFTPYYPGPGLGGHCIPIDPFYLTWKAREYGLNTRFIELAGEVNTKMPEWVVDKVIKALNSHKKAVKDSKILILGVAYKKNIDDLRESPAIKIMELLKNEGANLNFSDPHVAKLQRSKILNFDSISIEISKEKLQTFDCVIIVTNHDKFDYNLIKKYSKLIIDTRGVYSKYNDKNIIKA